MDKLKDRKHKAMTIEISLSPESKVEDENKVLGIAPDLKKKDSKEDLVGLSETEQDGDPEMMDPMSKEAKMKDAEMALKGNMDESDELQFERMIDAKEQPKSLLDKARFKMYADKKGYESK